MKITRYFFLVILIFFSFSTPVSAGTDKTAPAIAWEVVQPGILAVTADDYDSMPVRIEVSLDGGRNWQMVEFPIAWSAQPVLMPSVTWNIELRPGANQVQIHAVDSAGNVSEASVEILNDVQND